MEFINNFLSDIFAFVFEYIKISYFVHIELYNFVIAYHREYFFATLFFSLIMIAVFFGVIKIFANYTIAYTYSYEIFEEEIYFSRLLRIALSDINFRVSNALHEAGHLVLYREITNLNYGYSKKILNSLSAEIKIIGNSSARVHSYEPNILFTKQEILLRMKMLIAGQIASKIF